MQGLRAALQQAVVGAFEGLDDLRTPILYQLLTGDVIRNVEAGTVTPVSRNFKINSAIFVRFTEKEIDQNVSVETDSKLLIPAALLKAEPKTADIIVERKSKKVWEVIRRLQDPGHAVISLHVRTSKTTATA